jgi:acyl transferase domain-containing protein
MLLDLVRSTECPECEAEERPYHLLRLSARTDGALRSVAAAFAQTLRALPAEELPDACYSANAERETFARRVAAVAQTPDDMADILEAFARGEHASAAAGRADKPLRVGFLFTGQGSQYVGMGSELYRSEPVFRRVLDVCTDILDPFLDEPLTSVMFGDADHTLIDRTRYTQPALFAFEYAMSELWRSWGVQPALVCGHSVGEYAAACVAGAMTLEDGLALIAERARLMEELPPGGAMAAVRADRDAVAARLEGHEQSVSLAAVNGPANLTVSGAADVLEAILGRLQSDGAAVQRLNVSHAFHSPLVEPMLDRFEASAADIDFARPGVPLVSNLTGTVLDDTPHAAYWGRHARAPVDFYGGLRQIQELGVDVLLEVGPQPVLIGLTRRALRAGAPELLASARSGQDEVATLLRSLASLYALGADIDWRQVDRCHERHHVALPTYRTDRSWYWIDPPEEDDVYRTARPA